jgi:NAD(P)-dependent dehydrogenase (short-subunit alcohol dehydrogenase family)
MDAMDLLIPFGLAEGLPLYGAKAVSVAYPVRDRVVLVTDADAGLGPEVSRRLTTRGAKLGLVGTYAQGLSRLVAELGGDAAGFVADLQAADELKSAIEAVVARFGSLDVVVAHAAASPITDAPDPHSALDANLRKTAAVLQAGIDHVVVRRGYALRLVPVAGILLDRAHRNDVHALTRRLRTAAEQYGARVGVAYVGKSSPDRVASAIIGGIERRARRVMVPWQSWAKAIVPGRFGNPADRRAHQAGTIA